MPASDVALGNVISLTLEPSSADIERKDEADPRPPKQGGGREGGRWESGWKVERKPAGLADRPDQDRSSAAPPLTKTPRKCVRKEGVKNIMYDNVTGRMLLIERTYLLVAMVVNLSVLDRTAAVSLVNSASVSIRTSAVAAAWKLVRIKQAAKTCWL